MKNEGNMENISPCSTYFNSVFNHVPHFNKAEPKWQRKGKLHTDYLADEIRCNDCIQLLEVPASLPCPLSSDSSGFGWFLLKAPAKENEVDGMAALLMVWNNQILGEIQTGNHSKHVDNTPQWCLFLHYCEVQ